MSLFGVFFSRKFLFQISSDDLLIKVFCSFLFISGVFMLYKKNFQFDKLNNQKTTYLNFIVLMIQGFLIGILTGLLGVGGGFLIVPVLIIFQKFNIKQAAKASMFLIFLNSFFSIIIDFSNNFFNLNSQLFLYILLFSIIGLLIGQKIQKSVDVKMMHRVFAFFLIIISLLIGFNM